MATVLIVDDDPKICLFFQNLLKKMGHASFSAYTLSEAREHGRTHPSDLVLLDLELPDGNGLEIIPELAKAPSRPEIIIITGTGDARGAEIAFKYGAWDYVQKPFLLNEVSLPITRALQYHQEKQAAREPKTLIRPGITGSSDALNKSLDDVARAAVTDASVLVTGETGTGKELFARAIHENSRRGKTPFIVVDCGALPENLVESTLFGHEKGAFTGAEKNQEGLISQAEGGTLMLDEIGELPLSVQKSFLRTLQEHRVRPIGGKKEMAVDFRLIAATNLDLDRQVREGHFREDLLYRIRAIEIKLPPLREREEDIEEIALKKTRELTQRYNLKAKALSDEFCKSLREYHWPGNIRELINVLEYALAGAGDDPTLFPKHLPPEYRTARIDFGTEQKSDSDAVDIPDAGTAEELPTLTEYRDASEKTYLKKLLHRAGGDRETACRISGISQSRLYSLLKKHHLPGFGSTP